MIVVKVELWPKGDESKARQIGELKIVNVGGDDDRGDYSVNVLELGGLRVQLDGEVRGHERVAPVWMLVGRALRSVGF